MKERYRFTEIEAKIHPMDEAQIELKENTKEGSYGEMMQAFRQALAYYYTCWVDDTVSLNAASLMPLHVMKAHWEKAKHSAMNYISEHCKATVYIDYNDDNFTSSGIYKIEKI